MSSLIIEYNYRQSEENELEPLLATLEEGFGGTREPILRSKSALDLVTLLTVVTSFAVQATAQATIGKYLEGLLGSDQWKQLGDKHRHQVTIWLLDIKSEFTRIIHVTKPLINTHLITDKRGLALCFLIGSKELYVVLNHYSCSTEILNNLPNGILEAIKFLLENPLEEDANIFQLYFDQSSQKWRYLLAPSSQGFGRWIDRYIDLETKELKLINSRRQVLEIFKPDSHDEYKFLVNPFIKSRLLRNPKSN